MYNQQNFIRLILIHAVCLFHNKLSYSYSFLNFDSWAVKVSNKWFPEKFFKNQFKNTYWHNGFVDLKLRLVFQSLFIDQITYTYYSIRSIVLDFIKIPHNTYLFFIQTCYTRIAFKRLNGKSL